MAPKGLRLCVGLRGSYRNKGNPGSLELPSDHLLNRASASGGWMRDKSIHYRLIRARQQAFTRIKDRK